MVATPRARLAQAQRDGTAQKFPGGNIMDKRPRITEASVNAKIRLAPDAPESAQRYNDSLRSLVLSAVSEINRTFVDRDLSATGRQKRAKESALKTMERLNRSPEAILSYDRISEGLKKAEAALTAERKPLSTHHDLQLAAEIRRHLAEMPESKRRAWADQNRGNPVVVRAILTAAEAPFLFGMDPEAVEVFEDRAQRALHPDEYAERDRLQRAASDLERSTVAAEKLLAEAAGLRRARDGQTWLSEDEKDTTPSPLAAVAGETGDGND